MIAELPVPVQDPEQVRAVTREVLSRPEFQPAAPTPLERILDAISDLLGRMFEAIAGSGAGSLVGTVAVLVFIVALAALVVWLARGVGRDAARPPGLDDRLGRRAADWLADAQRAENAGDWREALRCRYRALLAELASEGVVEELPGRTAGEYLAAVATAVPDATSDFEVATRAFEVAWYGAGDTTDRDVEEFAVHARAAADAALGRRIAAGVQ